MERSGGKLDKSKILTTKNQKSSNKKNISNFTTNYEKKFKDISV